MDNKEKRFKINKIEHYDEKIAEKNGEICGLLISILAAAAFVGLCASLVAKWHHIVETDRFVSQLKWYNISDDIIENMNNNVINEVQWK